MESKRQGLKEATKDLIGVIDAVDKSVFETKKKAGEGFIIEDTIVVGVLKNQIKNINLSIGKALEVSGASDATDSMNDTVVFLKSFLPPAVEGDALRLIIQGLGAKSLGQAMGMLKKQSIEQGFDYEGTEAATISKEIFL